MDALFVIAHFELDSLQEADVRTLLSYARFDSRSESAFEVLGVGGFQGCQKSIGVKILGLGSIRLL